MATLSKIPCARVKCDGTFPRKGHQRFCSPSCRTQHYYDNNPEASKKNKDASSERSKKRKQERREWLNQYKSERGCCKCGFNVPQALQFNHINPEDKSFQISSRLDANWDEVLKEIDKCEILCANCHAIHTYENKHSQFRRLT